MRSSDSAVRRAFTSVVLVCLMGSSIVQAQEAGAKSAGQTMERGHNGESLQTLPNLGLTWQEQKAARRSACERDRDEARSELQASYRSHMRTCALQVGSSFGYLKEQGKQFLFEVTGMGAGSCATSLSRDFLMMGGVYDRRRDACLLAADKD